MKNQAPLPREDPSPPRQINETPDQPVTIEGPEPYVRKPGMGPREAIHFDGNPELPSREYESPAPAFKLAAGMFLPVVILVLVAIIVIIWFVL